MQTSTQLITVSVEFCKNGVSDKYLQSGWIEAVTARGVDTIKSEDSQRYNQPVAL